jgi:hypothetical protein
MGIFPILLSLLGLILFQVAQVQKPSSKPLQKTPRLTPPRPAPANKVMLTFVPTPSNARKVLRQG